MTTGCPFCRIEATEPELIVYSSPNVVAFLDIQPLVTSDAHVLVIPRKHCSTLLDVPEDIGRELGAALTVISRAVSKVTGSKDFNVVQNNGERAGQVVPHVHFHIVSRGTRHDKESGRNVSRIVQEMQSKISLRDRIGISSTMFGKGQRQSLSSKDMELVPALRENIRYTKSRL